MMHGGKMFETIKIGGRDCYIGIGGQKSSLRPGYLLIQPVSKNREESLESELALITELAGGDAAPCFVLAAFPVADWNADLTPWEAPPAFGDESFGSGAPETLLFIQEELIPAVLDRYFGMSATPDESFRRPDIFIGGYSLAGLFALWASIFIGFDGVAAVSPSVWYPGWMEFAECYDTFAEIVYLSLGDREERSRNPVMASVGDNIRRQAALLEASENCEACILEWNAGGHFAEPDLRTAKGFAWLLREKEDLKEK